MRAYAKRHGFTLIELLVVMAILGLLIALLLPVLGTAKSQAQAVTCSNNMHQVYLLVMQYAMDHNGELPHCNEINISTFRVDWNAYDEQNPEDSTLPSDKKWSGNYMDYYMRASNIPPDIWYCPSLMITQPFRRLPDRWMDHVVGDWDKSNFEIWIGLNYLANPPGLDWDTGKRGKYRQPWPVNIDTMDSTHTIFCDYCVLDRGKWGHFDDAEEVPEWVNFPHLGSTKARFTNMIMGDGSLYRKPLEEMKFGYRFIKPHNIFW